MVAEHGQQSPPEKPQDSRKGDRRSFWNFWKTLPGFLTALAAFIGAASTAWVTISTSCDPGAGGDPPPEVSEPVLFPYTPACYQAEIEYFERFPFSLKNQIEPQRFLYWAAFNIENECEGRLDIRVECMVSPEEIAACEPDPGEVSVPIGKSERIEATPNVQWLKESNRDVVLEFTWTVYHGDVKLNSFPAHITVSPRVFFFWSLSDPNGQEISKEYLLSTLGAWVLSGDDDVKEVADKIKEPIDNTSLEPAAIAASWTRQKLLPALRAVLTTSCSKSWVAPEPNSVTLEPSARASIAS